jgi:hypothetical protein
MAWGELFLRVASLNSELVLLASPNNFEYIYTKRRFSTPTCGTE